MATMASSLFEIGREVELVAQTSFEANDNLETDYVNGLMEDDDQKIVITDLDDNLKYKYPENYRVNQL